MSGDAEVLADVLVAIHDPSRLDELCPIVSHFLSEAASIPNFMMLTSSTDPLVKSSAFAYLPRLIDNWWDSFGASQPAAFTEIWERFAAARDPLEIRQIGKLIQIIHHKSEPSVLYEILRDGFQELAANAATGLQALVLAGILSHHYADDFPDDFGAVFLQSSYDLSHVALQIADPNLEIYHMRKSLKALIVASQNSGGMSCPMLQRYLRVLGVVPLEQLRSDRELYIYFQLLFQFALCYVDRHDPLFTLLMQWFFEKIIAISMNDHLVLEKRRTPLDAFAVAWLDLSASPLILQVLPVLFDCEISLFVTELREDSHQMDCPSTRILRKIVQTCPMEVAYNHFMRRMMGVLQGYPPDISAPVFGFYLRDVFDRLFRMICPNMDDQILPVMNVFIDGMGDKLRPRIVSGILAIVEALRDQHLAACLEFVCRCLHDSNAEVVNLAMRTFYSIVWKFNQGMVEQLWETRRRWLEIDVSY
jgi:hypothetical protein